MDLASEDALRLNVMLATASAVRIDENSLCVYGYTHSGEAMLRLNPNCRADRYLRAVRELLSSTVLGSPGGYPVYLKRWTRMGQMGNTRLADLLMLGEPEAVVAVACSPGLNEDLAQRCWWAMPDAGNARRMLARPAIADSTMGRVLAQFLLEFLPFEEDPAIIIETVRLLLRPGLITPGERLAIWRKGRLKNVFLVGFLQADPDNLPELPAAHPDAERLLPLLNTMPDNPYAVLLARTLPPAGQGFIATCHAILERPSNQDVVYALLDALGAYFSAARITQLSPTDTVESVRLHAETCCCLAAENPYHAALLNVFPMCRRALIALHVLAAARSELALRLFPGSASSALGSLMRKKLEPVSQPLLAELAALRHREETPSI